MTNWREVVATHTSDPDMTAPEIAEILRCDSAYVRATAKRRGMILQKSVRGPRTDLRALRRTCRRLMTELEEARAVLKRRKIRPAAILVAVRI